MKFNKIVPYVLILMLNVICVAGCQSDGRGNNLPVGLDETMITESEECAFASDVLKKVTIGELSGNICEISVEELDEIELISKNGEKIDMNSLGAEAVKSGKEQYGFVGDWNGYRIEGVINGTTLDCIGVYYAGENIIEEPSIFFTEYDITLGQSVDVLEKLGSPFGSDEDSYLWYSEGYEVLVFVEDDIISRIYVSRGAGWKNISTGEYVPATDLSTWEQVLSCSVGEIEINLCDTEIEEVAESFIWDEVERDKSKSKLISLLGYCNNSHIHIRGNEGEICSISSGLNTGKELDEVRIDTDLELFFTEYKIAVGQPVTVLEQLGAPDKVVKHAYCNTYEWMGSEAHYIDDAVVNFDFHTHVLCIQTEMGIISYIKFICYDTEVW